MKVKIKTCSSSVCKAGKSGNRNLDRKVTRHINKQIRQENKKVVTSLGEYEINFGRFQGFYFD